MLAIPLNSYIQPIVIMLAIPFGLVGAVIGHIIMGYSLSVLSLFGIVALSGVVVNDSLVLIHFANMRCGEGCGAMDAIHPNGHQLGLRHTFRHGYNPCYRTFRLHDR